jgi:glutamate synthase (ferredoxin)
MRLLAHNGEINTLLGNINWIKSRQFASENAGDSSSPSSVKGPLVDERNSDSANLDSVFENVIKNANRTPEEALMILVPQAYKDHPGIHNKDLKSFYSYYESQQEAWDGPALLVFSDGNRVGAALDRNGLRPARYMITSDESTGEKLVHVMSEVGVTMSLFDDNIDNSTKTSMRLIESGRLGPGEMLSVDLNKGTLQLNDDVKSSVAKQHSYVDWIKDTITDLPKSSAKTGNLYTVNPMTSII